MPRLIIVRGNSGSGKTSVAKLLQQKIGRNTLLISQDTVRREMLWVHDGSETTAIPLLIYLLEYGFRNSEITILEGILKASWYKPLFERAMQLFEDSIFAYYYDLSFEETLRRHNTKANQFDFGEAEMRQRWNEKDYIGFIQETILTEEMSLAETVQKILSDVQSKN